MLIVWNVDISNGGAWETLEIILLGLFGNGRGSFHNPCPICSCIWLKMDFHPYFNINNGKIGGAHECDMELVYIDTWAHFGCHMES